MKEKEKEPEKEPKMIMIPRGGRPRGSKNKTKAQDAADKEIFLKAFDEAHGILQPALKKLGWRRDTYNKIYEADVVFRTAVEDIRENSIDFVESQLMNQIGSGAVASTIFFLKTRAKNRGYVESSEFNVNLDAVKIRYVLPQSEDTKSITGGNIMNVEPNEVKEDGDEK